ncbi:MAG: GFA family protein [Sedimentisphaerales bacterium]|nr:GFA family protein [Sedimentisphaerales bacterium]
MKDTFTGGCLCGYVRYEHIGALGGANYCHCPDCRRTTGSAFSLGVRARVDSLRIVSGQVNAYTKIADSGNEITRQFCPECGSPLFTRSPAHPEFVYIKAGTLDDPTLVHPICQIWTAMRVPWADIGQGLTAYPRGRLTRSPEDPK